MLKVLLVDDEPSIRMTIGEFLKREGYEVLTATDGEQATVLIHSADIDIAVVDINLPRHSGVELLQELRAREPYVPVIMITGEPCLSQVSEIVRAGAYDFIAKPVVKDTIIRAVARAAEKKRLIAEKRRLELEVKQYAEDLEARVVKRTAELAEAYSFLNLVLNSSTEYAIIAVAIESHIMLFNHGAELLFGYTSDDALGRSPQELFFDTSRSGGKTFQACLEEADTSGHCQTEIYLHRADRTEFIASVAMTPIRASDWNLLGYLYVIRDLTAERRAEESLRRMQAHLAHHEKIAALGRVAVQVAHEVKNPLAGLLLYAMHLKSKIAGKLSVGELSLVDKIIGTINHLSHTVEQIMNFTRPLNLAPRGVDLNRVVADVLHLLQPQMVDSTVETHLHLDESGVRGQLDETSLRSALINLVLNALQAMPEGGRLSITTGKCQSKMYLEITDTGVGMTEEQIKSIFEPFYTTKSQGLGLGMPYAQKVIEQHRGTIKVESHPGKGTRIQVEIPVEVESE